MARRDRESVNDGLSAILPGGSGSDLLGQVVANDRKRGGRQAHEQPPETPLQEHALSELPAAETTGAAEVAPTTPPDAEAKREPSDVLPEPAPVDNQTNTQADTYTRTQTDMQAAAPASAPRKSTEGKRSSPRAGTPSSDAGALLATRREEAARMASSSTVTITFRIPHELNDWLDAYVHSSWPKRVRKQELVAEALRLLIARRGQAGELILPTELLPDEESS